METPSNQYRVHQCSNCQEDTGYHCESCLCDLCPQCKENHVKDLKTINHNVLSYGDDYGKHRKHKHMNDRTAYETKKQQHRGTIHTIRNETLFYRLLLLPKIKADFKTCHTEFSLNQSKMLTKAQKLNDLIDKVREDFMCKVFYDFDFKHRCIKQKIEMIKYIASLQIYVHRYEQSAIIPLQFLSFIKKALPQIQFTHHTCQLSITESFNKEDVMESLVAIQITERGNRRIENKCVLKLMAVPGLHQSLDVTGVNDCYHITCVASDRVWVSDNRNNLILTDTTGDPLHRVVDSCKSFYDGYGLHTVNNESELIYIDRNYNINKLSKDMKTTSTFIERTDSTLKPRCVYWSPFTGDLLVGMCYMDEYIVTAGIVTRYNQSGQLTQIIQHDNTGWKLYSISKYITENNNGDVVVTDFDAVVVTEGGGRHRFSYTGHPSGSGLEPRGICTDALSHILVCDDISNTVHMLDQDGQFLSHLLTNSQEMGRPLSLSYDVNTHRLWVGSLSNKLFVYRYITRKDALTDQGHLMESTREIPTQGTENPQQGNQCLLKLISPPEIINSLTITGVNGCHHISCATSDWAWVNEYSNLFLTNTAADTLNRVNDFTGILNYFGAHTVNSESELFYIDRIYNINKLSKDMKTISTFMKRTYSPWRPRCMSWSPSTGDLLVGMYCILTGTGKVIRYNQSGQLIQTIHVQHGIEGRDLNSRPNYITENNNGDVVVSLSSAVVVTESRGKHRFSYTGPPSGSGLRPRGICTDALSHILVCDDKTRTLQMLDRDGQFLSHLLVSLSWLFSPYSLSYDINTHHLWVGLNNNKVYVCRYITRQDALTGENTPKPDGEALSSSTRAVE
nr:uncharacterized protein LOC117683900 [Crassostrea gigas]